MLISLAIPSNAMCGVCVFIHVTLIDVQIIMKYSPDVYYGSIEMQDQGC